MAFKTYGVDQRESENSVDFDAINRYVVETAGLEKRTTLPGVVSSIIDLGIQEQSDAEVVFTGSEEDEAEIIAEFPDTYFKDGLDPDTRKPVRLKCWPQKPIQCVAISVDIPDIIVDKGQFFGESNPLPLRLYMGGQYYLPNTGMIVGRPTPLRINKKLGAWSLAQNNLLHKMAVGAKLIEPNEPFLPQDIDKLLGQALQFDVQIYMKKSGDKEYYTEYIKYVSGLARGQSVDELEGEVYLVQFDDSNADAAIKDLRNHVVNTIKRAQNYEGSKIQKQIETVRGRKDTTDDKPAQEKAPTKPAPKPAAKPAPKPAAKRTAAEKAPEPHPDVDGFDSDIPW